MRHIARETFSDPHFGAWPIEFRLLWIGMLISGADDQGRMDDNAALIAAAIFPYDQQINAEIVELGLAMFAKQKKIMRYVAGGNGTGRRLIQILNWWRYQKSGQWAAISHFPPPRSWVDRIRTHEGQQIVMTNWDRTGGFDKGRLLRSANVGATKPHRRASAGPAEGIDEDEVKRGSRRREDETHLPPTPSRAATKTAGGQDTKSKGHDWPTIDTIKKILSAAGLRDSKTITSLSELVATRNLHDPVDEVLAAIAAAYADDRVRDPAAVAASALQQGKVHPAFRDPKTWRSVPADALAAAGIDDLDQYASKRKIENFVKG